MTKPNKFCSNKEWLYDQYVTQMKSESQIARELGCQQETVGRYIHKFGIKLRTQAEEISGERHPLYGKPRSGKDKEAISKSLSGENNPNFGKKRPEHSALMSGPGNPRWHVKVDEETLKQKSESMLKFYEEHPEAKIELSQKSLEYNKLHPEKGQNQSEYLKQYYIDNPITIERRQKRSQDMKVWHSTHTQPEKSCKSVGGYIKNLNDRTFWLRSSYETRYATVLNNFGINWDYECKAFHIHTLDATYRPDFYLPKENLYIEVKGYMSDVDKIKLTEFNEIYPNEKLLLVYIEHIKQLEKCFESIIIQNFGIDLKEQVGLWKQENKNFVESNKLTNKKPKECSLDKYF